MDPVALYDVLNCASILLIAAEEEPGVAEQAYLEATFRAPDAFPAGPLADALNLILGAVGDMAKGAPA